MRYLLDSNTLRYLANREPGYERIIRNVHSVGFDGCLLSSVAVYELQASVLNKKLMQTERGSISRLIGFFKVLSFGRKAAADAGKIKATLLQAGQQIEDVDVMIAGHAMSIGAAVATSNVKHFGRVPGLTVRNWLKPLP